MSHPDAAQHHILAAPRVKTICRAYLGAEKVLSIAAILYFTVL